MAPCASQSVVAGRVIVTSPLGVRFDGDLPPEVAAADQPPCPGHPAALHRERMVPQRLVAEVCLELLAEGDPEFEVVAAGVGTPGRFRGGPPKCVDPCCTAAFLQVSWFRKRSGPGRVCRPRPSHLADSSAWLADGLGRAIRQGPLDPIMCCAPVRTTAFFHRRWGSRRIGPFHRGPNCSIRLSRLNILRGRGDFSFCGLSGRRSTPVWRR